MKKKGILLVLTSTLLWAFMGISSKALSDLSFTTSSISFFRLSAAAVGFTLFVFFKSRSTLKIDRKGLIISAIYGILCFSICFTSFNMAVARIPIAVATVLMFTNPIWVSIFNRILFKEKIGVKKFSVILLCITGCVLISKIYDLGHVKFDKIGILCGLATGLLFALQLIVPEYYKNEYRKDSLLAYGFIFGTIFLAFFTDFSGSFKIITTSSEPWYPIVNIIIIGFVCTFIANTFYIKATEYIDTSLTSMLVAFEPVIGTIMAFFIFGQKVDFVQVIGMFVVIASVLLLQSKFITGDKHKLELDIDGNL